MHASIEELLSLRDGEPAAGATAAHVAGCARCRAELDQLRHVRSALGALPLQEPAPSAWARITQRAARPAYSPFALLATGFAAAAALGLVGLLVTRAQKPESAQAPAVATTTEPAAADSAPATAPPAATAGPAAVAATDTEALIARSRLLEAVLEKVRYEPQVVNAGTAATIATLEDHIALVDYRLNLEVEDPLSPEQSRRLWQQRVDLMDSLVNVRYAQLQRVSY
jgi:hypothetical protein